LLYTKFFTR